MIRCLLVLLFSIITVLFATSSQAYARERLEIGNVSKSECQSFCLDSSISCNMAYYYVGGKNAGTCRFTEDLEPNLKWNGRYDVYSNWLGKWLDKSDVSKHWPWLLQKKPARLSTPQGSPDPDNCGCVSKSAIEAGPYTENNCLKLRQEEPDWLIKWAPKNQGTCIICYPEDILCSAKIPGRTTGGAGKKRCMTPPQTYATVRGYMIDTSSFGGAGPSHCATDKFAEALKAKGITVKPTNKICWACPIEKATVVKNSNGSSYCAKCPAGKKYRNGCCY